MTKYVRWSTRTRHFCDKLGLDIPILLAPMAGACPVQLSVAVAQQGGLGACGVLLMQPDAILDWANQFRMQSNGVFQMNNWIPDSPPVRNQIHEDRVQDFIASWQLDAGATIPHAEPPQFEAQCEAMLAAEPQVISSIMGIYPDSFVERIKTAGIVWLATVTTVEEAKLAEAAGADVIVAQGFEAGGHRGTFVAENDSQSAAGLFALIPTIVDAVSIPVVATGGIADHRGVAAALTLGASAVQIGTGFLRTPEAAIPSTWADAIGNAAPDDTQLTRAFSGRLGRSIGTEYVTAAAATSAPEPLPYPLQRQLTSHLTATARQNNDLTRMQAWAGQAGRLSAPLPASKLVSSLWYDARKLLK